MQSRRYWLSSILAFGVVAAIAAIGMVTDWGRNWQGSAATPGAATAPRLEAKVLPAFSLPPLASSYQETVERPLFVWTRRAAPPGNSVQIAMKKGQFRLAGTTLAEGSEVAFLFELATNKTHRISKGAAINGVTVEMVASNRVTLKQGDETEELTLRTTASPRAPPASQPVAQNAAMPGAAPMAAGAPAPPGAPGGNFGPPLQPGQASAGFAPPGMPVSAANNAGGPPIPSITQNAPNVPIPPSLSPASPPDANTNIPPTAETPTDPNQPAQRRRRFQNLPQ